MADGLGGDHYQLNKLAIWRSTAENEVDFTFFVWHREVARSAGSGMRARGGGGRPGGRGRRAAGRRSGRNVDTGQRMEIAPESAGDGFDGQCRGPRLPLPPSRRWRWDRFPATGKASLGGGPRGKRLRPGARNSTCDDQPRRRRIQAETLDCAGQAGVRNASPEFVRTIAFDLQWLSETRPDRRGLPQRRSTSQLASALRMRLVQSTLVRFESRS